VSTPPRFLPPSPALLAEVRALADRTLSAAEVDAYVHAPMTDEEQQEILDLIRWFTTRYATPGERLAYGRRRRRAQLR
jgi:hypothetical protein